jgi:hypothetical protein
MNGHVRDGNFINEFKIQECKGVLKDIIGT